MSFYYSIQNSEFDNYNISTPYTFNYDSGFSYPSFDNDRQQEFSSGNSKPEVELLQFLLYSDDKLLHIRYSETDISPNYYHKSMSDILNNIDGGGLSDSILAKSDMFSKRRRVPKSFDFFMQQLRDGVEITPRWVTIDSFLIIEMTKTMPVLRQLSFEDKIHLYSRNGLTAIVFSMLFYSKNLQRSDVLISPAGMSPILIKHDETSNLLFYKHLIRIAEFNLSREEFLILRVLILLHTATTELSKIGFGIIHAELEKLSKTLMFYEQHKWGDAKGAERFANLNPYLIKLFEHFYCGRQFQPQII
uniref:NR LBD domain-containing protein n=1 Tax=Meloidogyne javanica TaxID=6303 RepID=A0A915N9J0_MELJA